MIETYKIVTGKYQPRVAPTLHKGTVFVTRGNDLKLEKSQVKYDLRKFGFTNRVVNTWNSLPNWVVSANTTNTFKTRLNTHAMRIIKNRLYGAACSLFCDMSDTYSSFLGRF